MTGACNAFVETGFCLENIKLLGGHLHWTSLLFFYQVCTFRIIPLTCAGVSMRPLKCDHYSKSWLAKAWCIQHVAINHNPERIFIILKIPHDFPKHNSLRSRYLLPLLRKKFHTCGGVGKPFFCTSYRYSLLQGIKKGLRDVEHQWLWFAFRK